MAEDTDDLELIRGSGNVYADLGMKEPEVRQLRAILAAEISKTMTADGISTREAHRLTGTPASDFSRIRLAKLEGFTVDRLMTILERLGQEVHVSVSVGPRAISQSQPVLAG